MDETKISAVECQTCGLLVCAGDYGDLLIAAAGNHEAVAHDGEAMPTEGPGRPENCKGSEKLGRVMPF